MSVHQRAIGGGRKPSRGFGSSVRVPTVATLGILVPILLVSGLASAVPAGATTVFRAPYAGTTAGISTVSTSGCGGTGSFPTLTSFSLTRGVVAGSGAASQKACGSKGQDFAQALGTALFTSSTTFVVPGGWANLTSTWNLSYNATLTARPGNSTQEASAAFGISGFTYILDSAGGEYFASNSTWERAHNITSGSHDLTVKGLRVTVHWSQDLPAGTYHIQEYFLYFARALTSALGTSRASASLQLGLPGETLRFVSFTVS